MTPAPNWRRYLRFWRSNHGSDFDDELEFHIEERVDEYMARGMSADEARRKATARLGDVDAARAECIVLGQARETRDRRADFFDGLRADVRFALRSLGRSPGWTAVALLTIALGVGATTTVFSVVDALLVRTIPYPDASRVFNIQREFTIGGEKAFVGVPYAALREWRGNARTIEAVVPFSGDAGPLGTGPDAIQVNAALIDTSFLAFAGVHPLIGRNFNSHEVLPGGPGAILLTEQFWRRQYDRSPDVLGKRVQFEGEPRTIVGVLPASFSIPDFRAERADILAPLVLTPDLYGGPVMVRLKPGISRDAATKELDAIMKRARVVNTSMDPMPMRLRLDRPQDTLKIRQALLMLTGAVALLLLVACTNIAHLLLARGAARQRELAVRHALGARRSRLVRQLVTESVVLAMIGGTLAIFVGWAGLKVLTVVRPANLAALSYVSTNRDIVSVTAVLAILCGLAIGLLAALRTAHRDLGTVLRIGEASTPRTGRHLRALLVIGEVAFSTTLLVGALLLIHAVFDLQRTPLGFNARDLYAVSFQTTATERAAFGALLRERAARIAGTGHVTLATNAPSRNFVALSAFETPDRPRTGGPEGTAVEFVAPDYFAMMGMPLIRGRTFDEGSLARNEVLVSNSLAHQLWPGTNPVGRRFRNTIRRPDSSLRPWRTVIGVVPDVVRNLVDDPTQRAIYRPLGDTAARGGIAVLVRPRGNDPMEALGQFAASVQHSGSKPVMENVREDLDQSMAVPRFIMRILVAFAALGVLLSAIGLFGVISYSVAQRTREIGVRMALGATRRSIAGLIVRDGIRLALIGIAVGLLGAVAATRLVQSLLYGVSRIDPFAFSIGAILLLAVSIAACVVPMLRATGVDPAIAVRGE